MKVELVTTNEQFHSFKQCFAVQHDIRQKKISIIHAEDDAVIPDTIDVPMNLRMAIMPDSVVDRIMITMLHTPDKNQIVLPIESEPI